MQYEVLLQHELTCKMKTKTFSRTLNIAIFKDYYIKYSSLYEEKTHNIIEVHYYLVNTFSFN
jgi:hypothetical protein